MSLVEKFTETPSIDLLNVCKSSELKELCAHHEIPYDNATNKSNLKQLLIDNLIEKGILEEAESNGARHNIESIELQKYQLELEYKERIERAQIAAGREKHEKQLEADREKHDKEMELKRFEIETRIKLKEIECNSRTASLSNQFDISKQKGYVPPFNEYDVDMYFVQFEKVASQLEWPKDKWAIVLQTVLKGKAQTTYAALGVECSKDYDHVKKAILQAYQLVPEAYRQRFRDAKKSTDQNYVEFVSDSQYMLDRWCTSNNVDKDYERFRQLILLEQFQFSLSRDVAMYVDDHAPKDVHAAAMLADSYEVKQRVYPRNSVQQKIEYNTPCNNRYSNENPFLESRYRDNPACWYCKQTGHMRVACPLLNKDKPHLATNALICKHRAHEDTATGDQKSEYPQEYQPFISHGKVSLGSNDSRVRDITILRDTGATQTLMLSDALSLNSRSSVNTDILVRGFGIESIEVPLHKLYLKSDFKEGYVIVGIVNSLPVPGVTMLLGNDIAGCVVSPLARVNGEEDSFPETNRLYHVTPDEPNSVNHEDIADVYLRETVVREIKENQDISGVDISANNAIENVLESSKLDDRNTSISFTRLSYVPNKDEEIKSLITDVDADVSFDAQYDTAEPAVVMSLNLPLSASSADVTNTKSRNDNSEFVKMCYVRQITDKPNRNPPKSHYPVPAYNEPFNRVIIDWVEPLRVTRATGFQAWCVLMLLLMSAHLLFVVRDSARNSSECSPAQLAFGYNVRRPISPVKEICFSSREEYMIHYVNKFRRQLTTRRIAADNLARSNVSLKIRLERDGSMRHHAFSEGVPVLFALPVCIKPVPEKIFGSCVSSTNCITNMPDRCDGTQLCHVNMNYFVRDVAIHQEAIPVATSVRVEEIDNSDENVRSSQLRKGTVLSNVALTLGYVSLQEPVDLTATILIRMGWFPNSGVRGQTNVTEYDFNIIIVYFSIKQCQRHCSGTEREIAGSLVFTNKCGVCVVTTLRLIMWVTNFQWQAHDMHEYNH